MPFEFGTDYMATGRSFLVFLLEPEDGGAASDDAHQAFAHVGHWRYCLKTNTSEWSDGMFAIYGLDPKIDLARNLEHGSIIEEDSEAVRKVLEKAVLGRQSFTLKARIRTKATTLLTRDCAGWPRSAFEFRHKVRRRLPTP